MGGWHTRLSASSQEERILKLTVSFRRLIPRCETRTKSCRLFDQSSVTPQWRSIHGRAGRNTLRDKLGRMCARASLSRVSGPYYRNQTLQAGPPWHRFKFRVARHQSAVVDAGRRVRIYPRSSSLMLAGWLAMRPGLRNDALIVYNCR